MRAKLEAAGGKVLEEVSLSSVDVFADGVALTINGQTAAGGAHVDAAGAAAAQQQGPRVQYSSTVTTRLLLDCMGHASPVVRQLRCVFVCGNAAEWAGEQVSLVCTNRPIKRGVWCGQGISHGHPVSNLSQTPACHLPLVADTWCQTHSVFPLVNSTCSGWRWR